MSSVTLQQVSITHICYNLVKGNTQTVFLLIVHYDIIYHQLSNENEMVYKNMFINQRMDKVKMSCTFFFNKLNIAPMITNILELLPFPLS